MPIRYRRMRCPGRAPASSERSRCTETAARTAVETELNTASTESPVVSMIRPSAALTRLAKVARAASSVSRVVSAFRAIRREYPTPSATSIATRWCRTLESTSPPTRVRRNQRHWILRLPSFGLHNEDSNQFSKSSLAFGENSQDVFRALRDGGSRNLMNEIPT